jgi:hypothetical protein
MRPSFRIWNIEIIAPVVRGMVPTLLAGMAVLVALFLVGSVVYGVTAYVAASIVLDDAPFVESLFVGPALAMGVVSAGSLTPLAVPFVAIPLDFFGVMWSYEFGERTAGVVTAIHLLLSVVATVALLGAVGIVR